MAEDKGKKEEEEKAEAPAEGEGAEAAPKKSKKKKLIIIIAGAVVLVGVVVGGLVAGGVIGGAEGEKKEEHAKEGEHAEGQVDKCKEGAQDVHKEGKKEDGGHGGDDKAAVDPCKPVYVDLQDLIVNLTSESRRQHFVNLRLTLELKNASAVGDVEASMPRIIDSFNTYLREMTKEDLEGSEGLIRLEDEMMLRLNKILKPGTVTDILYRSVIVQ
jgi:flagellar protein FliL